MGSFLNITASKNKQVTKDAPGMSQEQKKLVELIKKRVTINGLLQILCEFRASPKIGLDYEEFDELMSPMLNYTQPLFTALKDKSNCVNFYEAYIVLVLFCRAADYEERMRLVFDSFDIDSNGALDHKELSQFIDAAIFGLCKICGIPEPSKLKVSKFISDQFVIVDSDGSGFIEYEEYLEWINQSSEIQDFILRYTRVQTIDRARLEYAKHCKYWNDLFMRISVEYFGDRFVEIEILTKILDEELAEHSLLMRKQLYAIMTYDGEQIIRQDVFESIMSIWSSFSANDINNDNQLDLGEIKMLWWLIEGQKPTNSVMEREMRVMDTDGNGQIDRMEWMAYLISPKEPGQTNKGNMNHFDFDLRDNF